ncbi:TPA: VWA domain-containing protein [Aeromonas hydrophila]|uniref:VWA domain-containing protein n=1 Tax=Aeromonas hydrophila TaxID=644 RepID=UPI0005CEEFC5|nr:VWA domain-containing protein [Aeromonas hydrophila]AJQ54787.1 von Willebrand factor A [Aeromonas hydrophila]HAU4882657.1 VWA domain-containing protein [Aeromonas hydrophila]
MELTLLRPLWLLALLPWLWQGWHRRRQAPLLAPAMQAYLLPGQRRHFPWLWLACLPLILALSGPALRQQSQSVPSPALDIWLLDLSRSMLATDLLPDRATRVRVLLQDLLADREQQEAAHPIALILFAGDAYLAMPPTRDHQALALLLPDLRPAIMPRQGSAPERAVALALKQIPAGQQARLLLITDDLTTRQAERIKAVWPCQGSLFCHAQVQASLDVLLANSGQASRLPAAMGGGFGRALPAPDVATLQQLAGDLGGQLQWLQQGAPRFAPLPMSQTTGAHQAMDLGPWLLLPLLPLALLARIGTLWLVLVGALLLTPPSLQANPAVANPPPVGDNLAWQAFLQKRYQEAARAFADPVWQGNAWYRAGDYAKAAAAYGRASTATAHYNRGNALVQLDQLAAAEQAYLAALALEPSHQDARYNLTLLRAQPPEATPQAQDPKPIDAPEQAATPDAPLPPSPPVLLLEQRLRKEDQRRRQQEADRGLAPGILKGEDHW